MENSTMDAHDRRVYDTEIADLKITCENTESRFKELKTECINLKLELALLRGDVKDLVEAWQTAKGITNFLKWLSAIITAWVIIFTYYKGIK